MREFKFRAWYPLVEKMRHFSNGEIIADGEDRYGMFFPVDEGNIFLSSCIVMQWTGLKDKNGIEIYEGDIISNTARQYRAVVKFGEYTPDVFESWLMQYKNSFMQSMQGFYAEGVWGMNEGQQLFLSKDISVEVIGNIHDNPELLEVKL